MPISLAIRRAFYLLLAGGVGIVIGAYTMSGNITPDSDNSRDLGSQTSRLANIHTVDIDAAFSSSTEVKIGISGTILDGFYMATTSINPNSLTAWSTTSSLVTIPGMVAEDFCSVANPYTASGTAINVTCVAGSGAGTLTFRAATSASFNAEPAVFTIFGASKRP